MRGIVVEESLMDARVINDWVVLDAKISGHELPEDRWHLYQVDLEPEQIRELEHLLRPGWYAHFWEGTHITAVFSGKTFIFDSQDRDSWTDVLAWGRSLGIPDEQLDFPIVE